MDDQAAKKKAAQAFYCIRHASTGNTPAPDQGNETITDLLIMPQTNSKCSSNKADLAHDKDDSETTKVSRGKGHPLSNNKSANNPVFLPFVEGNNLDLPTVPNATCQSKENATCQSKEIVAFQSDQSNVERIRVYSSHNKPGCCQGPICAPYSDFIKSRCIDYQSGNAAHRATIFAEMLGRFEFYRFPEDTRMDDKESMKKARYAFRSFSRQASTRENPAPDQGQERMSQKNSTCSPNEADLGREEEDSETDEVSREKVHAKIRVACGSGCSNVRKYPGDTFFIRTVKGRLDEFRNGDSSQQERVLDSLMHKFEFYTLKDNRLLDEDSSHLKIQSAFVCQLDKSTMSCNIPYQEGVGALFGDFSSLIDAGAVCPTEEGTGIVDCNVKGNISDSAADKILVYFKVGRSNHPSFASYKELIQSKRKDYQNGRSVVRMKMIDDLVDRVEFYLLPKKTQLDEEASRNKILKALMRRKDTGSGKSSIPKTADNKSPASQSSPETNLDIRCGTESSIMRKYTCNSTSQLPDLPSKISYPEAVESLLNAYGMGNEFQQAKIIDVVLRRFPEKVRLDSKAARVRVQQAFERRTKKTKSTLLVQRTLPIREARRQKYVLLAGLEAQIFASIPDLLYTTILSKAFWTNIRMETNLSVKGLSIHLWICFLFIA